MQKKSARLSAFSMIELAIAITIIAIIIAGMTQSKTLIAGARLSNAQTLTQNTSVKDMADMVAWYETSLETSFLFKEQTEGASISEWIDSNPNSASRNSAAQSTAGNKPKLYQAVINDGIPVVRFDGTDDFMTFDGKSLVGGSYTIFVVEQRRAGGAMMFLGDTSTESFRVGYLSDTAIAQANSNTVSNNCAVSAYSSPTPTIHSFWFNVSDGQKYWKNGGLSPDDSATGFTTAIASYPTAALGRYLTNYFNGDLAEIIIFNRALQTTERQVVEDYLSKKYGIVIS